MFSLLGFGKDSEPVRTLFDNIAAAMAVALLDGTLLKANRAYCNLLGYTEEELLKLNVLDITCPEDQCLTTDRFQEANEKQQSIFHYEKRFLRKDGAIVWGLVSLSCIMDSPDSTSYCVALIQDITARKGMERSLRESEELYRTLVENIDLGINLISEDRRILKINAATSRMMAKSADELVGCNCFREFERRDKVCDFCPGARSMETGEPDAVITEGIREDGTRIVVRLRTFPVRDPDGTARKFVEVAEDITEQMDVRDALRESEQRFRAIFKNAASGIYTVSPQGIFLQVNPAFCRLLGYSEEEILGKALEDVTHPDDLELSRHMLRKTLSGPPFSVHFEKRYRHKDGSVIWVHLSGVWQLDDSGLPAYGIGMVQDITARKRSEERLRYLANYDALTDLPKRQALETVLQHALERSRSDKQRLALLVLDLDQYKSINESFGHKVGDDLLVAVAKRLKEKIRREDALSRLAGDGFALVIEGVEDYSDVEVVAHDLQTSLDAPFALPDGHQIYLHGSIGVSIFPQDGDTVRDLLRGAEVAVNLAKERGGNQFCYCTSELNAQARIRMELQAELGQGIERNEFVLYYQPKVELRSGRIAGAEALIRWNHPDKGLIQPTQFISIAEKNGLIVPLGAWVIEAACRQIRQWEDAGLKKTKVAVNVSAQQFSSGQLEDVITNALRDYGIEPHCLMLELTESMLMDEPEAAITKITALRRIGVRISLDDFGTGYSSLGYLGRLPIDQLKIDRSFITDIVTDPKAATIAASVIALAHRMGLKVVAEGVETTAQLSYLKRNGCDEIQGFYFSEPVPPKAFTSMLCQNKSLPAEEKSPDIQTLLVVDDEPNILNSLCRLLQDDGYRVLTAESGREGLELLARNTVQVVIADQRMPEMSGGEFLRRVKSLYPGTVRLVLSGHSDLSSITESINEGALYKFLIKPWDDYELREQIRDAFAFYETNAGPANYLSP